MIWKLSALLCVSKISIYNIWVDTIFFYYLKRSSITLKIKCTWCVVYTQVNKKNSYYRVCITRVTSYKINYCLNVALCQHLAYLLVVLYGIPSIKLIDRLKRPLYKIIFRHSFSPFIIKIFVLYTKLMKNTITFPCDYIAKSQTKIKQIVWNYATPTKNL